MVTGPDTFMPTSERLSSVPLYALTDPKADSVEFLGTGTLVRIQNRDILVTAAHVIENGRKFILMVAGPEKPVLVNRPALVTPVQPGLSRGTDPLDFCVIRLSPKEAEALQTRCRFVEWEQEALTDVPRIAWPHKITGYPDTDNDPARDSKTLLANCLRVDAMEDRRVIRHAPWPGVKAHPSWYVGLRYDPRLLEKRRARPKVSSLHGCSGGAIWRTDGTRTLGFAGILIQCQSPKARRTGERVVYGFRAKAMDDLLKHWIEKEALV